MANEIKTNLTLTGEDQYTNALNKSFNALKVLKSELKTSTAEMGKNATAQDKAKVKAESLKKQIKQQEKIVEQLAKALEQAKTEYADNEEVQQKWQIKLNSAKTVLFNMKNSLETCNESIKGFGQAMKDVPNDTGNAAQGVVDLGSAMEKVIGLASKIKDAVAGSFGGILDNIKAISSEAWALMTGTMANVEDWKGIQDAYGGSVEQIQDFFGITKMADIDPSVLTGGMEKLITKTHSGDKATKALLKSWGLDEDQFSSHWDYFVAVWEKLQSMQSDSERFNAAGVLFGDKSADEIFTLLSKWNGAKAAYGDRVAGSGMTLSQSQIEQIDATWARLVELNTMFDAFKTKIGSELIINFGLGGDVETLQDILSDVSKIFFGSDSESAEAKASLVVDIQTLFENVTGGISNLASWLGELQSTLNESDDPIVRSFGNLMGSLQKLLQWIADHADTIITLLTKWIEFKAKDFGVEITTGRSIGEWAETVGDIGKTALQIGFVKKLLTPAKGAGSASANAANAANASQKAALGGAGLSTVLAGGTFAAALAGAGYATIKSINDIALLAKDKYQAFDAVLNDPLNEYMPQSVKNSHQMDSTADFLYGWYNQNHTKGDDESTSAGIRFTDGITFGGGSGSFADAENALTDALDSYESSTTEAMQNISDNLLNGIKSINIVLDGVTVGSMVAPYVDAALGQ